MAKEKISLESKLEELTNVTERILKAGAACEEDKHIFLDGMLQEGETYSYKFLGTIIPKLGIWFYLSKSAGGGAAAAVMLHHKAYIGVTENYINLASISNVEIRMLKERIEIPMNKILKIKMRNTFFRKGYKVTFKIDDDDRPKIKVHVAKHYDTFLSRLTRFNFKGQREAVKEFKNFVDNFNLKSRKK